MVYFFRFHTWGRFFVFVGTKLKIKAQPCISSRPRVHIINTQCCISSKRSLVYHHALGVYIIKALPCISSRPACISSTPALHLIKALPCISSRPACISSTPALHIIKALPCSQKYNFIKHTEPSTAQKEKKWRSTRRFRQI